MSLPKKDFYTESLLDSPLHLRTWHFQGRFPFIKIVDFTIPIRDAQGVLNQYLNLFLTNRMNRKGDK